MPDGDMAGKVTQRFLIEYIGHTSHIGKNPDFFAIGRGNAGAFLTAVLECKEGKKCETGYILIRGINTKNAARLVQD